MRIAIYNRNFDADDIPLFEQLFEECEKREIELVLYEQLAANLKGQVNLPTVFDTFSTTKPLVDNVDFIFSMGGDGTILDTVCHVGARNIPILGINLGNLGFLAATLQTEIPLALDCLERDKYQLDHRALLHLESSVDIFPGSNFALNDFSIQRKDSSALVKIHTYLNGSFLCTYLGDGLIVSTPTGSTGYNLSCGGPIITPQTNSFIITPVAPHNLNVRPIIIPDSTIVSFELEGRAKEFLCTLDARIETVNSSIALAVSKQHYGINLVRLPGHDFLSTLRQKLYWGIDRRH
jgi:NAD+ kinase